jgi:hypothetical protein
MQVYVVRKWLLQGSCFVFWNITWVSLWLLCNVHFVQSTQKTQTRQFVHGTNNCSSEEYRCTHVDVCVVRTWILYWCVPCHLWCTHRTSLVVKKKLFQFSCGCAQFHEGRSFDFLVINVCYHTEHYEMPCIDKKSLQQAAHILLKLFNNVALWLSGIVW